MPPTLMLNKKLTVPLTLTLDKIHHAPNPNDKQKPIAEVKSRGVGSCCRECPRVGTHFQLTPGGCLEGIVNLRIERCIKRVQFINFGFANTHLYLPKFELKTHPSTIFCSIQLMLPGIKCK